MYDAIRAKLPCLRDLGINAIGIMPASEFPGGFSWGYNPSHIFAVESDHGGPNALKRLVRDTHEHGIAVILFETTCCSGPKITAWTVLVFVYRVGSLHSRCRTSRTRGYR
jgi:hypothetical protein